MNKKLDRYDSGKLTSMYNFSEIERQRLDQKLKNMLRERELLSEEDLQRALERQAATSLSLWRTLVNLGMLTPKDIDALLKHDPLLIVPINDRKFGVFLVENNYISKQTLREAIKQQKENNKLLSDTLLTMGHLGEEDLARALAAAYRLPYVDLSGQNIDAGLLNEWPAKVLFRNLILPVRREDEHLILAFSDPRQINTFLESHMRFLLGTAIKPVIASGQQVRVVLEKHFAAWEGVKDGLQPMTPEELMRNRMEIFEAIVEKAGSARLTDFLVHEGFAYSATDIHIEEHNDDIRVRFRIDGQLHEMVSLDKKTGKALGNRLKVASNMDITEKRAPQDGHGMLTYDGQPLEFRLSSVPTIHGEKLVLRLFHKNKVISSLSQMGLEPEQIELLTYFAQSPHGMFLTTGPVGSGKTTMLYALLNNIDILRKNIMTIEDPVEYYLPGVNQMQISKHVSFAQGLRAFLRQDPDVIMVGEIRDEETAQIAVRAAMTGILMLSTLHCTEAASAIIALKNLGVQPFLIASALLGVVNQRLIRKICPDCRDEYHPDPLLLEKLQLSQEIYYHGQGCGCCLGTGFRGLTGMFEVMFVDAAIKNLTLENASVDQLKVAAVAAGMTTLKQNAIRKIQAGTTAIEEVVRVV